MYGIMLTKNSELTDTTILYFLQKFNRQSSCEKKRPLEKIDTPVYESFSTQNEIETPGIV
jgi:hypothetical protein